mmetsp:Transcript_3314/g.7866  ORF Transcript_3314/g.7866 Transcript_3314/m.7866 type:complete len:289 (-) Transcript_3314:267-1133(-)
MPPAQKAEAKASSQLNHTNGSDQRSKNSNNGSINGNKHNGNNNSSSYHAQRSNQSNRRMGQQTATLPAGVPPRTAAAPSSSHGYPYNQSNTATSAPSQQPTPLFQRLVTEEVQELKAYARIIENQNRRLVELERIHGDLENRLELEARGRAQLETTLERRERSWTMKYHDLEKDRDQWKSVVSQEEAKNARLFDQVVRKDQDIHRMLQRKYDNQRETGPGQQIRNMRHNERQSQGTSPRQAPHNQDPTHQRMGSDLNKSPHEILATTGSMETVRIRNVTTLLNDFFAI